MVTGRSSDISHQYSPSGEYEIQIAGVTPEIIFGGSLDAAKVVSIKDWGVDAWENVDSMFDGCINLSGYSAIDPPVFAASVTSYRNMFRGCSLLSANFNNWTTTGVTDTSYMFDGCTLFNSDLDTWDMSIVTDMSYMFNQAVNFAGNISSWIVSQVVNFSHTFFNTSSFNSNLSSWVTSSATNMEFMFTNSSISGNLGSWSTGLVTTMEQMFRGASNLFGQTLLWDTGLVTNMDYMFEGVGSITSSYGVSSWNISSLTSALSFMANHNMSVVQYNSILNNWGNQTPNSNIVISFGTSKYDGLALIRRDKLIDPPYNWTIIDGGIVTMTLIAGFDDPFFTGDVYGYQLNGIGNLAPRSIGGYTINVITWEPSKIPPGSNVFSIGTQGAPPSDYWDSIIIEDISTGSVTATTVLNRSQVNFTGTVTISGQTTFEQRIGGVSNMFTSGNTYRITIVK